MSMLINIKVTNYICSLLSNSSIMLRPHSMSEHTKVNKAIELDIIVNIGTVITPGKAKNIINGIMLSTNIIN